MNTQANHNIRLLVPFFRNPPQLMYSLLSEKLWQFDLAPPRSTWQPFPPVPVPPKADRVANLLIEAVAAVDLVALRKSHPTRLAS